MKKIERLQAQLHMTDAPQLNKRIVFVEDDEEARSFDTAEYLQCPPIAVAHGSAHVRTQHLKEAAVVKNAESQQDVVVSCVEEVRNPLMHPLHISDRVRRKQYKELELRQKRMRELQLVHEKLEKQTLIAVSNGLEGCLLKGVPAFRKHPRAKSRVRNARTRRVQRPSTNGHTCDAVERYCCTCP